MARWILALGKDASPTRIFNAPEEMRLRFSSAGWSVGR